MEREFLKNLDLGGGARLSKDVIDAIMAEHGKTVNPLRKQVDDLTKERDGLKDRAEAAESIVQKIPKDQDPAKLLEALEQAQNDLAAAEKDYNAKVAARTSTTPSKPRWRGSSLPPRRRSGTWPGRSGRRA